MPVAELQLGVLVLESEGWQRLRQGCTSWLASYGLEAGAGQPGVTLLGAARWVEASC